MRRNDKQRIITILAVLSLISFSLTWWLIRTPRIKPASPFMYSSRISKPASEVCQETTARFMSPDQCFHMRQHGTYWILYNYIRAEQEYRGNQSVTLILQGEWADLQYLPNILKRWQAPISFTLFTNGDDFTRTKDYLSHLYYCTSSGGDIRSYVSVNLLIHQNYLPHFMPSTKKNFLEKPSQCSDGMEFDFKLNYRLKQNLTYPINLARNIGRETSLTYYILSMDMDFIPISGVPEQFLNMAADLRVEQKAKTVFVLPTFEINYNNFIPDCKEDLTVLYTETLKDYLNSTSLYKIPHLDEWIESEVKLDTGIFDKIKRKAPWLAFYISVNDMEPFYDVTYTSESHIDRSVQLDLLESLNYDFHILNSEFVLRHKNSTYFLKSNQPQKPREIERTQKKLLLLKNFLMNFM